MAHEGEVAGRDGAKSSRYGVAPSLALGLDGPTRLTLSYLHQSTDDRPDYGLPWLGSVPAPVPRHNFYGFESDYLETDANILSADVSHAAERSAHAARAIARRALHAQEPAHRAVDPGGLRQLAARADYRELATYSPAESEETMAQAQGDATLRFGSGNVEHALVTGLELVARDLGAVVRFRASACRTTNLLVAELRKSRSRQRAQCRG